MSPKIGGECNNEGCNAETHAGLDLCCISREWSASNPVSGKDNDHCREFNVRGYAHKKSYTKYWPVQFGMVWYGMV